jgi:hypothetical protein
MANGCVTIRKATNSVDNRLSGKESATIFLTSIESWALNGVRSAMRVHGVLCMRGAHPFVNVSTPHMTLRSFVTRSFTRSPFATLLVAGAPLSVFAASGNCVAVWLITPDKTSLIAEQPQRLSFGKASVGAKTILVDDRTIQTTDLNGVNSCFVRAYYC